MEAPIPRLLSVYNIIMKKKLAEICAIYWQDAAYSFRKRLPKELPPVQITTGVIISQNKTLINVATNLTYHTKRSVVAPRDGFLIPKKTVLKIQKIGRLDG